MPFGFYFMSLENTSCRFAAVGVTFFVPLISTVGVPPVPLPHDLIIILHLLWNYLLRSLDDSRARNGAHNWTSDE